MKSQEAWMERALELAEKAQEQDEVPVGAVIVLNDQIIAEGWNTREGFHDPLGHAEVMAIQEASKKMASWRLENCILICTLEPCIMCMGALYQARISKLIYGAKDPKGGALSLGYNVHEDVRLNHRFTVEYSPAASSETLLKNFFKTKRREAKT